MTSTLKAEAVTGFNRLFGEPRYRYDFLPEAMQEIGVQMLAIHNPGGTEPLPLLPSSPDDAELASMVDPNLEIMFPGFQVSSVAEGAVNLPIREVETITSGDLQGRSKVAMYDHAEPVSRFQAGPVEPDPITKKEWMKASGTFQSTPDGDEHRLVIRVRDLIPNRAYTVWGMWWMASGAWFPQPFAGVPNGYITDPKGNATFERTLPFDPFAASQNGLSGHRLVSIITHIHSDHALYGGVPVPLAGGYPPGTVLHTQLEWNFPGTGDKL